MARRTLLYQKKIVKVVTRSLFDQKLPNICLMFGTNWPNIDVLFDNNNPNKSNMFDEL